MSEPFSMDHYLVFNRLFNGYKTKKNASPGRLLVDPHLYTNGPFYVVRQYSIRKPEYTSQEPVEDDDRDEISNGETIKKKSKYLSNSYIMLRP